MQRTNEQYGADLKNKDAKKLKKQLEQKADKIITKEVGNFSIQKNTIESERKDALARINELGKSADEINEQFDMRIKEVTDALKGYIA